MDDREQQSRRLRNPHRSKGSKIGWKRHRDSYMRANRRKERDNMNKTFISVARDLEEALGIDEAKILKYDIFDYKFEVLFDNISGGLSFSIKDGNISFSTLLNENGHGNYKLETPPQNEEAYKELYNDLKDELQTIASSLDESFKSILSKHGLRET